MCVYLIRLFILMKVICHTEAIYLICPHNPLIKIQAPIISKITNKKKTVSLKITLVKVKAFKYYIIHPRHPPPAPHHPPPPDLVWNK